MAMVLLVEDNLTNRKLLRDILEIKFDVLEAESAESAAEVLKDHQPDIIFMDLQLPGMDGLTFIRRLKRDPATRPIPIVAISAHAMASDIQEALASGCAEYVTKPLLEDPYEFAERMASFLTQGTGPGIRDQEAVTFEPRDTVGRRGLIA
jgi:CheY-like chemotaxis protein